jgi:hypothetical protein
MATNKGILPKTTQRVRVIEAALASLIMIVVSLPVTYDLTNSLFGSLGLKNLILTPAKTAKMPGVLIHAVVFFLLLWATLELVDRYASTD